MIHSNANTYNYHSKKIMLSNIPNHILQTQRIMKLNKNSKMLTNDFDSNDEDINQIYPYTGDLKDKIYQTIYGSSYINNEINTKKNHSNDKFNRFNYLKRIILPFDLNSTIILENKNILKQIIKKELENKKIKYIFKKNKCTCWKNDSKLIIQIINIDEENNCYTINFHIKKQNNNFFNLLFCKEFFKNIIYKYKLNK